MEPQIIFVKNVFRGKLDVLIGGSSEQTTNNDLYVQGIGYSSDALISNLESAQTVFPSYDNSLYKYEAAFARINYNWPDKYIVMLSGRRDGSSRFGPGKQFGNFGAVSGAWLFTNENFLKNKIPFLSFGKLRGSYGTTGNDQIGNYMFYDSWSPINYTRPYDGTNPIAPTQLFNPNFQWEVDKKLEFALEMGFFNDRIDFSANYFRNRTGNELVMVPLLGTNRI